MNMKYKWSRFVYCSFFMVIVAGVVLGLELRYQKQRLACFKLLQENDLQISEFRTQLGEPVTSSKGSSELCYEFDLQLYSRGIVCEAVVGGEVVAYIQWRDPAVDIVKMMGDLYSSFFSRIFRGKKVANNCREIGLVESNRMG